MSQTFSVTGLSCQSCVKHVTQAISALAGVQSVTVDLQPQGTSTLHVEAADLLDADQVQAALAQQGNYLLAR